MRARAFTLLSIAAATLMTSKVTAFAHHSSAAEFDGHKWTTLRGTVTKVEWTNPHTFFYIDVKDPKTGTVVNWACELGSPNLLVARGWKRDTLRAGMLIDLTGTLARDGSHKVNARHVVADGVRLSPWPSDGANP